MNSYIKSLQYAAAFAALLCVPILSPAALVVDVGQGSTVTNRYEAFVKTGTGTLVLNTFMPPTGLCAVVSGKVKLTGHAAKYAGLFRRRDDIALPSGYTMLDYIRLSGANANSYVDTGYTPASTSFGYLLDFYIDRDGAMMPAQFGTAIQLPLVTGFVKTRHIQPLHDFALFLKGDDFWSAEITQIYIRENGDAELIPRIGDHTILIGSFDDTQQKLDNVRTFYDKVLTRKGWNFYKTINVKFHGQVVGEK